MNVLKLKIYSSHFDKILNLYYSSGNFEATSKFKKNPIWLELRTCTCIKNIIKILYKKLAACSS